MSKERAQLLFVASLRTQHITLDMLHDFFNQSYVETKGEVPEDYFYSFMRHAIREGIRVVKEFEEDDIMSDFEDLLKERNGDVLNVN